LRESHNRLFRAEDSSKLLVVTYASDGNTLPDLNYLFQYLFIYLKISIRLFNVNYTNINKDDVRRRFFQSFYSYFCQK